MNKRFIMQLMRTIVTLIVLLTMAAMIFSLRQENSELREKVKALSLQVEQLKKG